MRAFRWKNLIANWEERALFATTAFVLYASLSAVANADVTSVEGLEFSRVQLVGSNELELTQGDSNKLKIRGDGDALTPPPFVIQDGALRLGVTPGGGSVTDLKFKLTATAITALLLEGSGDIYVKPLSVEDLLISVDGSGEIRMFDINARDLELRVVGAGAIQAVNVSARNARLNLKGSGDIQLGRLEADAIKTHIAGSGDVLLQDEGSARHLDVGLMGSGDIDLKGLVATEAKVVIMGSGDTIVRVTDVLEAEILGSGDLVYYGNPKASTSVMGSGDITQRD